MKADYPKSLAESLINGADPFDWNNEKLLNDIKSLIPGNIVMDPHFKNKILPKDFLTNKHLKTMNSTLITNRLYLREFTIDDAQNLMDLNSDPEVIRYTGDALVKDLEDAKRILTDIIFPQYKNKLGRWAVHLRSNDEFIGWSGIKYLAELNEYDLGYRFFKKHWGQGYATESGKAVMNYGINELKLKEIVGRASVENLNSIKVLEKVGLKFKEEGFEHGEKIVKYRGEY